HQGKWGILSHTKTGEQRSLFLSQTILPQATRSPLQTSRIRSLEHLTRRRRRCRSLLDRVVMISRLVYSTRLHCQLLHRKSIPPPYSSTTPAPSCTSWAMVATISTHTRS